MKFYSLYFEEKFGTTQTYYLGVDVAIITTQGHGGSPQLVVSGDPYFGGDGTAPRVEKEVLGPRDDVRHGLRYRWNKKVDDVLSPNRLVVLLFIFTTFHHPQMVGRCAVYTGWHWNRFILARVKGASAHWSRLVSKVK